MKQVLVVAISVLVLYGCNTGPEVITTKNGLTIKRISKGDGIEVIPGQMLIMNFTIADKNDSIIINTYKEGIARPAAKADSLWYGNQGGIEEVLFYLTKGDSVTCRLSADKIYRETPPEGVSKDDMLNITIKLEDVVSKIDYSEYIQKMRKDFQLKRNDEEIVIIDKYLEENQIEALNTESKLRYVIHNEGEGETAQEGQQVTANYTGHILEGDYFDSSIKEVAQEKGLYDERREPYGPYSFIVGQGQVIRGWDEGFQLLKKGAKATLYIPSDLGYGPRGRSEVIVANSILVFEVEVIDIKNVSDDSVE